MRFAPEKDTARTSAGPRFGTEVVISNPERGKCEQFAGIVNYYGYMALEVDSQYVSMVLPGPATRFHGHATPIRSAVIAIV